MEVSKILFIASLQSSRAKRQRLYELTNHSKKKAKHLKRIKMLSAAIAVVLKEYNEIKGNTQ